MSEGTKLGEFKDDLEFNQAVAQPSNFSEESEAKGTKLGETSDFEQSLLDEGSLTSFADDGEDEMTMEALLEQELEQSVVDYEVGDVVKGVIRSVEKGGILVDIGYKSDGFIANNEVAETTVNGQKNEVMPGQETDVYIIKLETKEGYAMVSQKRALFELSWKFLMDAIKAKTIISVKVVNRVEGGLVAQFNGIRGFIPASQVLENRDDNLDNYLSQTLEVMVLQVDRRRKKVIFSVKQVKQQPSEEQLAAIEQLFTSLEIGETREGRVTSIKDFGVFVDIGGVEGLVHISELSWARVSHPSEVVNSGDEVKVFVLGVDRDNRKVSLGMKQLHEDPWVSVNEKFKLDDIVEGEVTRIVKFGAFIKITNELEGLVHISEIASRHIAQVEDVLHSGQKVNARIIKLKADEQKIGLSLLGIDGQPMNAEAGTHMVAAKDSEEESVEG